MLRLLNSLKTRIWSPVSGMVSLGFKGNAIVLARAENTQEGYVITHLAEEILPISLFTNSVPTDADCVIFSQALERLSALVPQGYWPLQIALPDPVAIVQVMQFDSLPEATHEREAIAKFRLEKEFPASIKMQCATQDISKPDKPGLLLSVFFQEAWLDCLKKACSAAGLLPSVIDLSLNHLFNRFYDVIKTVSGDGVLVFVEESSWSILIWDGDHRPRFVRSRWFDVGVEKNVEYELIVEDVERLILSYVLRVHRRKVGSIYVCANAEDRLLLAAMLDKRMKIPCVSLDVTEGVVFAQGEGVQNLPAGLLAALKPRI